MEAEAKLAAVQAATAPPTQLRSHLSNGRQGLSSGESLRQRYEAVLEPLQAKFLAPLESMAMTTRGTLGYSPLQALYAYAAPTVTQAAHSFDIYMPLVLGAFDRLLQCGPTAPEYMPADYVRGISLENNCHLGDDATTSEDSYKSATRKLAASVLEDAQERCDFQTPISDEYVTRDPPPRPPPRARPRPLSSTPPLRIGPLSSPPPPPPSPPPYPPYPDP